MNPDPAVTSSPHRPHRVLIGAAAWLAVYAVTRLALEANAVQPALREMVSFIPMFAFFAFVWVVQRAVKDSDELQRLIQLQALALSFSTTICVLMGLGLLDVAHGGRLALPPLRDLWAFLPPIYGICLAVAYRRYR